MTTTTVTAPISLDPQIHQEEFDEDHRPVGLIQFTSTTTSSSSSSLSSSTPSVIVPGEGQVAEAEAAAEGITIFFQAASLTLTDHHHRHVYSLTEENTRFSTNTTTPIGTLLEWTTIVSSSSSSLSDTSSSSNDDEKTPQSHEEHQQQEINLRFYLRTPAQNQWRWNSKRQQQNDEEQRRRPPYDWQLYLSWIRVSSPATLTMVEYDYWNPNDSLESAILVPAAPTSTATAEGEGSSNVPIISNKNNPSGSSKTTESTLSLSESDPTETLGPPSSHHSNSASTAAATTAAASSANAYYTAFACDEVLLTYHPLVVVGGGGGTGALGAMGDNNNAASFTLKATNVVFGTSIDHPYNPCGSLGTCRIVNGDTLTCGHAMIWQYMVALVVGLLCCACWIFTRCMTYWDYGGGGGGYPYNYGSAMIFGGDGSGGNNDYSMVQHQQQQRQRRRGRRQRRRARRQRRVAYDRILPDDHDDLDDDELEEFYDEGIEMQKATANASTPKVANGGTICGNGYYYSGHPSSRNGNGHSAGNSNVGADGYYYDDEGGGGDEGDEEDHDVEADDNVMDDIDDEYDDVSSFDWSAEDGTSTVSSIGTHSLGGGSSSAANASSRRHHSQQQQQQQYPRRQSSGISSNTMNADESFLTNPSYEDPSFTAGGGGSR